MGDEQDGDRDGLPDFQDQLLQDGAGERVDRAERLVHQQHVGLADQRARDADALLHAAGELIGIIVLVAVEPDQTDVFQAARARLGRESFL